MQHTFLYTSFSLLPLCCATRLQCETSRNMIHVLFRKCWMRSCPLFFTAPFSVQRKLLCSSLSHALALSLLTMSVQMLQVKFDFSLKLLNLGQLFPLSPRVGRQRKLRINLRKIKLNLKSNLTCNIDIKIQLKKRLGFAVVSKSPGGHVQPAKASVSPSLYAAGDVSQARPRDLLPKMKGCLK